MLGSSVLQESGFSWYAVKNLQWSCQCILCGCRRCNCFSYRCRVW